MTFYYLRRHNPNYRNYNNYKNIQCCSTGDIPTNNIKQWIKEYNGDGALPYIAISIPKSCVEKVLKIKFNDKERLCCDWPLPWPE